MLTITKEFTFDSAHKLVDGYVGACENLHGHTYHLFVTLGYNKSKFKSELASLNRFGMLFDFKELKQIWKEKIEPLVDHQYLNDSFERQPTAELMALRFYELFNQELDNSKYMITEIKLYETPTSYATYTPEAKVFKK